MKMTQTTGTRRKARLKDATIEDVERIEISKEGRTGYVIGFCQANACHADSYTTRLYRLTFNRPMYSSYDIFKYETWTCCKEHLPEKIKDSPQIKLAEFAARAKGTGGEEK